MWRFLCISSPFPLPLRPLPQPPLCLILPCSVGQPQDRISSFECFPALVEQPSQGLCLEPYHVKSRSEDECHTSLC